MWRALLHQLTSLCARGRCCCYLTMSWPVDQPNTIICLSDMSIFSCIQKRCDTKINKEIKSNQNYLVFVFQLFCVRGPISRCLKIEKNIVFSLCSLLLYWRWQNIRGNFQCFPIFIILIFSFKISPASPWIKCDCRALTLQRLTGAAATNRWWQLHKYQWLAPLAIQSVWA